MPKVLCFPANFQDIGLLHPLLAHPSFSIRFQNMQKCIGFISISDALTGPCWTAKGNLKNPKTSVTLHGNASRKCKMSATLHGKVFLHYRQTSPVQIGLPKKAPNRFKQTLLNAFWKSMGAPEHARPKNGSAQVDANDRPEPWRKNERHAAWERSCARRNERHAAWERFSSPHGPFLPPKGERRILENKAPERQSGKTSPPHAAWERDF